MAFSWLFSLAFILVYHHNSVDESLFYKLCVYWQCSVGCTDTFCIEIHANYFGSEINSV